MIVKGTILRCLQEWVETHHGEAAWACAVERAGATAADGSSLRFAPQANIPDEIAIGLFEATAATLEGTVGDVFDGFGRWWAHAYGPRLYASAYDEPDFVAFLVRVNEIHRRVTEETRGRPPVLELSWSSPTCMTIGYRSARGLVDAAAGLVRGHLERFGVEATVRVRSATRLEIEFAHPTEQGFSLIPPSRASQQPRSWA